MIPKPIPKKLPDPLTIEDIVKTLQKVMKRKRQLLIAEDDIRYLYEALIELLMTEVIARGQVRLPDGWGSLVLKVLNERGTPRLTPGGHVVPVGPRAAVRLREGLALREVLGKLSKSEYQRRKPRISKLV